MPATLIQCNSCTRQLDLSAADSARLRPRMDGAYSVFDWRVAVHLDGTHARCDECQAAGRKAPVGCIVWDGFTGPPRSDSDYRPPVWLFDRQRYEYPDHLDMRRNRYTVYKEEAYRVTADRRLHNVPERPLSGRGRWIQYPRTIRWRARDSQVMEVDLVKRRIRKVVRGGHLFRTERDPESTLTWMKTATQRTWNAVFQIEPGRICTVTIGGWLVFQDDDGTADVIRPPGGT